MEVFIWHHIFPRYTDRMKAMAQGLAISKINAGFLKLTPKG